MKKFFILFSTFETKWHKSIRDASHSNNLNLKIIAHPLPKIPNAARDKFKIKGDPGNRERA
jgi:hypothetical protein